MKIDLIEAKPVGLQIQEDRLGSQNMWAGAGASVAANCLNGIAVTASQPVTMSQL